MAVLVNDNDTPPQASTAELALWLAITVILAIAIVGTLANLGLGIISKTSRENADTFTEVRK